MDNFSIFVWTVPLKNKYAETIKDTFGIIHISTKTKPNLIEADRGKHFLTVIFKV